MILLFQQKTPGNVVVLLFFGLLLKAPLFLYPATIHATENDEDLYHALVSFIQSSSNSAITASVVAFLLLFVQALTVNSFMNSFKMLGKSTYLPGMAYLLVTSLLPEWTYLSSPLVASTLVLFMIPLLFRLYNTDQARGAIFNMGLLLGLSSYIYFPAASFLLCFLLGMFVLKPFRFNEVVLFLLGCFTPYYFYGAYLFLNDRLSFENFLPHLSVTVPQVRSTVWLAVSTLFLTLPFLAGGFFVQGQLHKMLIQARKNWSIILLYLVLAFFVPFVNTYTSFSNWVLIAAPFACFHAATYFFIGRKWLANSLFFLTVGFVLYLQYWTLLWQ